LVISIKVKQPAAGISQYFIVGVKVVEAIALVYFCSSFGYLSPIYSWARVEV